MLSRMHSKLGTAGLVVAIVALVAALTGAAFAAGGLTKSQEKQVKKIAKKYAGKNGAPGTAGAPGPAGPAGEKGATGATGPEGPEGPQGPKGDKGAAGTPGTDGKDGGFSEVMESGTTLRGNWSIGQTSGEAFAMDSVSFLMEYPGSEPPKVVYKNTGGEEFPAQAETEAEEAEEHCPGSATAPEAEPGFVCFYEGLASGSVTFWAPFTNFGKSNWGATLVVKPAIVEEKPTQALVMGTWAVTAP